MTYIQLILSFSVSLVCTFLPTLHPQSIPPAHTYKHIYIYTHRTQLPAQGGIQDWHSLAASTNKKCQNIPQARQCECQPRNVYVCVCTQQQHHRHHHPLFTLTSCFVYTIIHSISYVNHSGERSLC